MNEVAQAIRSIKNIFHGVDDIVKPNSKDAEFIAKASKALSAVPPFRLVWFVHDKHSAWHKHYHRSIRGIKIQHESVIEDHQSRTKAHKEKATDIGNG